MRTVLTTAVVIALTHTAVDAQETREIRRGQSIPGMLAADSEHRYAIELGANTFVQNLFNGAALVLAVALSQLVRGRQEQSLT